MDRAALIARIETKHCPNSTDAGMTASNHRIKDGACTICDRSTDAVARLHGI